MAQEYWCKRESGVFGPASIVDCLERLAPDDLISSSPEGPWIKLKEFDFPPSQRRQQPEIAARRPQNLPGPHPTINDLRKPHSRKSFWWGVTDWETVKTILWVTVKTILWVSLLIIPICEYIIPFYGVWLLGGFFAWAFIAVSHENVDNLLANLLWIISWPAGVIICGYEKYMRWDGSFFGIRFGQGQQVSNEASDFWFLMYIIGGGLLFAVFLYGLCAGVSNAASDIIATGIKKAKDND